MRSKAFALSILFAVLSGVACSPGKNPAPAEMTVGTLTVDAYISKGTRFNVYCNNGPPKPERQQVVPGERVKYSFPLPAVLESLRLDPSEVAGSHVVIYSVVIHLPGMAKKLIPLTDLPKFLKYHCSVKQMLDSVEIDADGPDMYVMSTVNPSTYPVAR